MFSHPTANNPISSISSPVIGKVNLSKKVITKVLSNLISVIERRPLISILAHIKIQIYLDRIEFTATDMDITIVEAISINNDFTTCFTVSAHLFYDIARKWPEDTFLELNITTSKITISNNHSHFLLSTLEGEQFPCLTSEALKLQFTLLKEDFLSLLESTKHTISTENSRINLVGLYLHSSPEEQLLYAASTDGHRLALSNCFLKTIEKFGILIPRKTILELLSLFSKLQITEIQLTLYGEDTINRVKLSVNNLSLTSKLISATFPDYQKVIPQAFNFIISLNKETFIGAIHRVACVLNEKNYAIKITFSVNSMKLLALGTDGSTAQEYIEIKEFKDLSMEISFNYIYLLEACSVIKSKFLQLSIIDGKSPALLQAEPSDNITNIIMPMIN